ncbi:MAG: 39S ribosomal protein L24, mitochondrial [Chrysothrix sp. TS-e1954]|nr:MAG: 39S ribosomal protein L24, mitochondrial [Chrysothrix sp. TS-e1954]
MPARPRYPAHYHVPEIYRPIKRVTTNFLAFLPKDAPPPPKYPYGAAQFFKQSNRGLYGGATKMYGNNVSEKFTTKTRRTWYPNVQTKHIYSRALGRWIRLHITTRTLRTIDKVGGLDEYVLGRTSARVKELGPLGWDLRWVILNTPSVLERMQTDIGLRRLYEGTEDPNYVREQRKLAREEDASEAERIEEEEESLEEGEYEEAYDPREGPTLEGAADLDRQGHMLEQPKPPERRSAWQRIKGFATDPLGRRRTA